MPVIFPTIFSNDNVLVFRDLKIGLDVIITVKLTDPVLYLI